MEAMNVPCCQYCGAHREFELQLMPGLLALPLGRPSNESSEIGLSLGGNLDFGVVVVYSCSESCSDGTEEYAVVQMSFADEQPTSKTS